MPRWRGCALAEAKVADEAELNLAMHWLHDHRFYLSVAQCEEVNRLNQEAAKRLPSDAWRIVYDVFEPDEEMNDSYFLPE